MTPVPALTDGARTWIAALDTMLWLLPTQRWRRRGEPPLPRREAREMTEEEWERLKTLLVDFRLYCVLTNIHYGFGLGMVVLEHPEQMGFEPESLLLVSQDHLPRRSESDSKRWDIAWNTFTAYTHSDDAKQFATFYKHKPPQSRSAYEY